MSDPNSKPATWPRRGVMITGTDTGVGKTLVAGALAGALRGRGIGVGVMKPITTGAPRVGGVLVSEDARFLQAAAGTADADELVCPFRFTAPAAPATAAEAEGKEIPILEILERFEELCTRHELVLVEGAGGLAVPIQGKYLFADLTLDLELPLLVVARAGLGTINHTLLTLHYAKSHGLEVLGVVINGYPDTPDLAERTAPDVIERVSGVPILGRLPLLEGADVNDNALAAAVSAMEQSGVPNRLLEHLAALTSE